MDALEDKDLVLQRASADLLSELHFSIPRLLFKTSGASTKRELRSEISYVATAHLIRLLEPFQEWPQLLDAHLSALVTPLGEVFLELLVSSKGHLASLRSPRSKRIPLLRAICKILYTFCKIRGSKVVCRFLSNEPKFVAPLLEAFERGIKASPRPKDGTHGVVHAFVWEEKFIMLTWLCHLMLAPFDLSTIASSVSEGDSLTIQNLAHLALPPDLPGITIRLVGVAIAHMHAAGKERDAAIAMLVRLVLRPDMRKLGLHEALVRYSIHQLQSDIAADMAVLTYKSIGLLSFLARLIKSADAADVAPYLLYIFSSIRKLNVLHSEKSSALARKSIIKMYTAISVASLQLDQMDDYQGINISESVLEEVIDDLFSSLGDSETPVRQAASKALSLITTKLTPDMAADISEVIIEGLNENVLWDLVPELSVDGSVASGERVIKRRNLAAVNPLKWHGLILTLSHLLFRRSLPNAQLPAILKCLILGLSFEQRSPSGAVLGSNVRDAACFGIWALARRYSSQELLALGAASAMSTRLRIAKVSVIQALALELVVTATIDPSGNIRRGASAALQELIGRHPDTVQDGIGLVRVVDYHAVALRSRALIEVAIGAANLGEIYWQAILEELTTWRGIGATDIESRRLAAEAIGILSTLEDRSRVPEVTKELWQSLNALDGSGIPKRQGFMLAMAAVVQTSVHLRRSEATIHSLQRQWDIFSEGLLLSEHDFIAATLNPDLTAEGACSLIHELAMASYGESAPLRAPCSSILDQSLQYINLALSRKHSIVVERAAEAAEALLKLLPLEVRDSWIRECIAKSSVQRGSNISGSSGHLHALGSMHLSYLTTPTTHAHVTNTILAILKDGKDVDARIAAAKSLKMLLLNNNGNLDSKVAVTVQTALQDYTTDQRGDVGSILRLEGIASVQSMYQKPEFDDLDGRHLLLEALSTLAGEKLDKVRCQAWQSLLGFWQRDNADSLGGLAEYAFYPSFANLSKEGRETEQVSTDQVTSREYFSRVFSLFRYKPLVPHLWKGLVTSISGGSESVLLASRSALSEYIESLGQTQVVLFCKSFEDLLRNNLSTERLVVPILESLAFVLDIHRIKDARDETFRWRNLLALVQKAHYKTNNVVKLHAAVDVYVALGEVEQIRHEVFKKLVSLLSHPFPKIRFASTDALFTITQNQRLLLLDWSKSPKEMKSTLNNIQVDLAQSMEPRI